MRIGLFGGSFDPVHRAHEALAEQAVKQFALKRLIWIPAFQSPFKNNSEMRASPENRLDMVRRVCQDHPLFEVSDYEIQKGGISYSVETLKFFQKQFPQAQFFWILGSDALADLPRWKDSETLFRDLTFLVATRDKKGVALLPHIQMHAIDLDWNPIASSDLKKNLSQGKNWNHLHPEVARYIRLNQLYGVTR